MKKMLFLAAMLLSVFQLSAGGQQNDAAQASSQNETVDPYGAYDEPVTLTVGMRTFGTETVPTEEGLMFKELEKYGIDMEVLWTADASQYDSKVNMAIASGDIPDIMFVNAGQQLSSLVKGDMIADIGDYFHYFNEENAKYLGEGIGFEAVRSVTYDGKVKMIPMNISNTIANSFPLFLRKDWLDNLGLEVPETMDEFREVALAFAKNDPDGNGKNDTYGLAVMGKTNLIVDWGGLFGFFAGYGVQPLTWYDGMLFYSEDEKGNAVWDGKDPKVKAGLQLLADLYKEGAIPSDFPTMDGTRVTEDLTAGYAGMVFGVRGLPIWAFPNAKATNPEAEWIAVDMPTEKAGDRPTLFAFQPVNVGYVVSKDCKNPEAAIKAINILNRAHATDPRFSGDRTVTGDAPIATNNPRQEMEENLLFFDAVEKRDPSILPAGLQERYEWVTDYMDNGTVENWKWWKAFGPEEGNAWYYTFVEQTPDMIKNNAYWRLPSAKMNSKLPIFKKMAEETITKIIMGIEPVTAWDTLVENWDKLGGADMTAEVQASLQ